MEHLTPWFQWLVLQDGCANPTWTIGCLLLVCVWGLGFRMAQPLEAPSGAVVPSSPLMFGLVVLAFVVLASALAYSAYDLYMQAYVYRSDSACLDAPSVVQ